MKKEIEDKVLNILARLSINENVETAFSDIDNLIKEHYYDNDREIAIIWNISDVQVIRDDLDDEQSMSVLANAKQTHHKWQGITWDVLRHHSSKLFPKE